MRRPPRLCSCGRSTPAGQACPCRVQREAERRARNDEARPSAAQRGYNSNWRKASKAFLALPGNERCACGCGRVANMVDHRKAPKGDMALFWDRSNWQPMNIACNTRKAIRSEGGFGNPTEGGRVKAKSLGGETGRVSLARTSPDFSIAGLRK